MTNIYLTDSDEEAIVDFVKNHGELTTPTSTLRTRQGRNTCLIGSPTVASCVQDLVRMPKKLSQSKSGQAPKEMTEAKLDSG